MKINGLLGLLISILSIGSIAEATQVVGQAVYGQPIYQSSSVVPATYVAPATTTVSSPVRTTSYYRPTSQSSNSITSTGGSGLAQSKATSAAQRGIRGHLGGGLGGAKYEGVGWSNRSAQNAIQSCCYWGTRPVSQIGVARGNDGFWYACVLYN